MNPIRELTRAEEEIMQEIWEMDGAFVKDIIEKLPEPKPAYNTVSTIVRILETKGFLRHEPFGKSHRYLPLIQKQEYKKIITGKLLNNYFDNSASSLLSYFLEERKISLNDLNDILDIIQEQKKK